MRYKKSLILICLIICLFSIASACASDVNETLGTSENQIILEGQDVVLFEVENQIDDDELSEFPGTFTDLANEIANADGELNLTRSYVYTSSDSIYEKGIEINKQIIVNGNNFTIDGNGQSRAFYIQNDNVTLKNMKFINCSGGISNKDYIFGGAINWNGNWGSLQNCSFVNCLANLCKSNSYFSKCCGGAVYWSGSNGVLDNCSFINCSSSSSIESEGGAVSWKGNLGSLKNCSFINCSSSSSIESEGGAVSWYGNLGSLQSCNFENCYLISNHSSKGSSIYWKGLNGILSNCTFINSNSDESTMGSVYWYGSNGVLTNCTFINSNSDESTMGSVYWFGSNGVLTNCSFVNCTSTSSSKFCGCAVYWFGSNGVLANCSFVNCSSSASRYRSNSNFGGAVYWEGTKGVLTNCSFVNCSVFSDGHGGAVYWKGTDGVLANCSFVNCSGSNYGGAIYWKGTGGVLANCSFVNCSSSNRGGAVYWAGTKGLLANNSFVKCFAFTRNGYSYGCALYWEGTNGVLANCSFINCSSSHCSGGSVCWTGNKGVLANCSFVNCYSILYSECFGALYWDASNGMVYGCNFVNCSLLSKTSSINIDGGAIHWSGSNGAVSDCNFINCTGYYSSPGYCIMGGAIYWSGSNGVVFNCNFLNCSSVMSQKSRGGAIYWSGSNGVVFNCNFLNCSSVMSRESSGGAIYWEGTEGNLSDCNFLNCSLVMTQESSGGAIYWHGSNGILVNCSFNGNDFLGTYVDPTAFNELKKSLIYLDINQVTFGYPLIFNLKYVDGMKGYCDIYVDDKYSGTLPDNSNKRIGGLNAGNHTLKIAYSGNDVFSKCEYITNFEVFKANANMTIIESNSFAGNTTIRVIMEKSSVTGNVTLKFSNKNYTNNLIDGETTFYISNLIAGIHSFIVDYSGDENFNPTFGKEYVNITVKLNNASIKIFNHDCFIDESLILEYDLNKNVTGIISIYANDLFIKNVSVGDIIELDNLKAGIYNIKLVYNGDDYFAPCENTTQLEVYKLNSDFYIDYDDIIAGNNIKLSFIFNEDATGDVNISIGNWIETDDEIIDAIWVDKYRFTCDLINGIASITTPNLSAGCYDIIIEYDGDEKYDSLWWDEEVYVNYKDSPINISFPKINWSDSVNLKPILPTGATGNIELLVDNIALANITVGNSYFYKAINGGKHYLTIKYFGDDYFIDNETTVEFYVNKLDSNFSIENTFDSERYITIPITLSDDANGDITVNINNNFYSGKVVNGSFNFTVADIGAGTHNLVINYTNDNKYDDICIAKEITVNLKDSNLNLDIQNILAGQNLLIKPSLTEGATGFVDIYVDGSFKKSINAGSSYTLQNPSVGQHKVRLVYSGNTYFESSENEYSFRVFTIYPIETVDTQIVFGTDKKFQAKFFDEYGGVLANKYVLFIVNGEEYPVKTNGEGITVLDVDLAVGEYNVTSVSLLDENTTNKLLIFHSVHAESMIMEYGSDTRFKATFLDETAKPLSNTNIVFKVDGKDTMVKTDVNGVAILNQELSIGTHTITSINTITDENMTNNVVVVSDIDSIITLDVNDITYTQKAILKVNIDPNYLNANIVIKVTGENGYEQIFIQKASKTITKEFTNLNASKYQVDVKYESSNLFVIQKNATFNVLKIDPIMTVNIDDGVIDHDLTLTSAIPNATGNVEVKINGRTYELQLVNGSVVKRLSNLVIGQNSVEIFYKGDNNHNPLIKTTTFKVWNNFELDIDFASELDQDIGEYYISIYNLGEDINKECLTLLIDGVKVDQEVMYSYDDEDECYIEIEFYVSDLTAGKHTWKINYFDAANYINTSKSDSFTVTIPPEPDTYQIAFIDNKSITYVPFDKINWNAKVVPVYYDLYEEYINYNFSTFTINGVEYNIVVSQLVSTASIYVSFNPNDYKKYDEIFYKVDNGQIVDVIDCMHYEVFGNEYYRFVGSGYKVFSENIGEVSYCIVNNNVYKIIGTMGASNAFFYDAVVNVDYKKVNGKYYTLNGEIISELTTSIPKGEIINSTFYVIDGNRYIPHNIWALGYEYISVNNSLFRVIYSEYDEKTYDRNTYALVDGILYSVDGNVVDKPVSIDMTQPIEDLTIPDLNNPSSDGSVIIELPSDATGSVTLTVNGKDYSFEVVNGVANIVLPNLTNGDYNYTIAYSGDIKYSSFVTNGTMTVNKTSDKPVENTTVEPEITIPPLDEPSDDGSVVVKLPADATGIVTLSINGKDYHFAVVNGIANVIVPDLGEGNYPYTITYSGDSKYSSFTTNGSLNKSAPKVDPRITAKNTAVQYSAKGKYSVTVYGTDGKVASGVQVIFKISGKQVGKAKTNTKGVASYVVTKNPGKYKIQATALGKSVTKTLTVKHIVTLKTATLKKSAKKLTLQATLAKVNGKYLKKKTITFKINGKKVATAKTNNKGVAKVTIKSSVLKKLKVGKKVTYQATYSKDTVKKTAKVKK